MVLSRRWSIFLLGFGVWSWIIWVTFIKNVANDPRSFTGHRPHAFFIVHLVLSIVSIILGTIIGAVGYRGWRAHGGTQPPGRTDQPGPS